MRIVSSIVLISIAALSFSQTRKIDVNVNLQVAPEVITATLNSQSENLDHCKIQISDSAKHITKTADFPKAKEKQSMKHYTETSIPTHDLAPGTYTCLIYMGKEEIYKKTFFKDAILAEPMPQPSIKHN